MDLITFLKKAPKGTVLEAASAVPELSAEATTVTVIENVVGDGGPRLTVRLHWHGILLAQKVAVIKNNQLEWSHA